jgi:predicted P-loop ATPase
LILEGAQGNRKSMALKTLAGKAWFTDELADLESKDAAMQVAGVWIIEMSELESMSKSEVGRVKAFLSRAVDRYRPPYGKHVIKAPRQCAFAGTTNDDAYLKDETGARRFWPVRCGYIDIEALSADRDQLWAEVVHLYDSGEKWWLEDPELVEAAREEQAVRFDADPWQQEIAKWIEDREDVSISEILSELLCKPKAQWGQADKNRIARTLKALGWEKFQKRVRGSDARESRYRRKALA